LVYTLQEGGRTILDVSQGERENRNIFYLPEVWTGIQILLREGSKCLKFEVP
jgi:hypothetical protein